MRCGWHPAAGNLTVHGSSQGDDEADDLQPFVSSDHAYHMTAWSALDAPQTPNVVPADHTDDKVASLNRGCKYLPDGNWTVQRHALQRKQRQHRPGEMSNLNRATSALLADGAESTSV